MIEKTEKAYLVTIENYSSSVESMEEGSDKLEVHFNPQTLKVQYANQNTGGDQPNGASAQNSGSLTSNLSVELLFDTTEAGTDVRELTKKVLKFIMPKEGNTDQTPPRARFQWGSFIFEGVISEFDETLEYFSAEGMPMRATISLSMKSDNINLLIKKLAGKGQQGGGLTNGVGVTSPLKPTKIGDSLAKIAGRAGVSANWKDIAAANDIDDPLRMSAGTLVNLNAKL